jgi:hypothetical protein
MTMLHFFASLPADFGAMLGVLGLDIDGYLLSQDFLGSFANLISSLLLGILNILLLGSLTPAT